MQIKKANVKATIDLVALRLFSSRGFEGTGMSDIAAAAGISVGNVYRYYKSKEDLFYSLVPQRLVNRGRSLLLEKIRLAHGIPIKTAGKKPQIQEKQKEFLAFLIHHRQPMIIAFRQGKGTRYESVVGETLLLIERLLEEYVVILYPRRRPALDQEQKVVLHTVYAQLLQGTLDILEKTEDESLAQSALERYLAYHFAGLPMILD